MPWSPTSTIPKWLLPIFGPDYLPLLSSELSSFHERGLYLAALSKANALDCLYRIIYPANYFMIGGCPSEWAIQMVTTCSFVVAGYHSLEQAKLTWNCIVRRQCEGEEEKFVELTRYHLQRAGSVLEISGGLDNDWREEIAVLEEELRHVK